tara:strand:+ start:2387 stop:2842 length:456 start_codon:yes stop_codon:yes gene_type:complete
MPVFKHCSVKERKLLAKLNKFLVTFKKGDFIIKQGFKSRTALPLYIIVNGSVLIKKRGVIKPLATLKAGSTFGEMSFLSKHPRTTNVIANEEVLVIKMNNHFFSAIPKNLKDKIKDYLIEVLIERLNNMNESFGKISNKEFSTKDRKKWFK